MLLSITRILFHSTHFFLKQHFYKQYPAEIGKKKADAKQHPPTELLLFGNYSHSSSTLSSKNNRTYSENKPKKKCVCIHTINHNENEDENEK